MPATRDDMLRRVALRLGYSGTDHDATGEALAIIKQAYDDTLAELAARNKAEFDPDAVPDALALSLGRYVANEAEQQMDRSRNIQTYEAEKLLAYRAYCRALAPIPAPSAEVPDPTGTGQTDYGRVGATQLRYL